MDKVTINGKEYLIDIEKCKERGLITEPISQTQIKTWEEFRRYYGEHEIPLYDLTGDGSMNKTTKYPSWWRSTTEKKAEALAAFGKLLLLRDTWIGGWKPNWEKNDLKWCVINSHNQVRVDHYYNLSSPLSFPTKEMAEDFLRTFIELLNQAQDLI